MTVANRVFVMYSQLKTKTKLIKKPSL